MSVERVVWVAVKRVVDHRVRVMPTADGLSADTAKLKHGLNPCDAYALQAALSMRDAGFFDAVHAVSLGDSRVDEVLYAALALGADRVSAIRWPFPFTQAAPNSLAVASLLHAYIRQPASVFLGKQATDTDNHQTGAVLAGLWQLPQIVSATAWETATADGALCIVAELGGKRRLYTLSASAQTVVTWDFGAGAVLRQPSLPALLRAKKQPIHTVFAEQDLQAVCLSDPGYHEPVRRAVRVPHRARRQEAIGSWEDWLQVSAAWFGEGTSQ